MPETPDFDSMTPEEVTRWMESLAKRQGATEGLTTNADMEVEEVSEDDERLAGQGDYIPHGWTKEKWEAQLAKEEEEKQRKAVEQQAQPPQIEPEPEPQPAAEMDAGVSDGLEDKLDAAAEGDMPDFENMSPEEAVRFMESLAKRQGATEGFTTSADMAVEEVRDDDERLAGQGEYIPHGWSKEKWEAHLAKEEEEKQHKAAAQQAQQAPEPVESIEADDAPQMPDVLSGADMDDDTESDAAPAPNFDDIFGGDNELPSLGDMDEEPAAAEETQPAASQEQNPMDWLSGLAGDEDEDDLDLDALGELEGTAEGDDDGDPMDWLAGLAGDEEDELDFDMGAFDDMDMGLDDDIAASADDTAFMDEMDDTDETDEGSLEWMETLAKRQGADSEELMTSASMDIPEADETDERGPGYEPYSFESGTGTTAEAFEDESDDEAISPPLAEFDTEQLDLDDPESWLDSLASGVAASGADADDAIGDDDEDEALTQDVTGKLRSGEDVSEDEIQSFFEAQFRRANKRDVPDYLDEDELDDFESFDIDAEADEGELVEADIPEWLRESMDQEPPIADMDDTPQDKTATAEMMVQELGLDDEIDTELDDDEFPDWLAGADDEDTGDISDIFAEEMDDTEPDIAASLAAEAESDMPDDMNIDTNDSWVAAFSGEDSEELADWYQRERARVEGEDELAGAQTAQPAADLKAADLPLETDLPQGQPQAMPQWMGSADTASDEPADVPASVSGSVETQAVEGDLDWLTEDDLEGEADIPDWLREQVDDSVTADDNVPDWLSEEDIDIDTDDVPDWLRETMEDEQDVIPAEQQLPEPDKPKLPEPEREPAQPAASIQPAAQSPAPVPTAAADIDIESTLSAARDNVTRNAVDEALHDYEQLIRANAVLDEVEKDITGLTEKHKKNPAVFRLLGDAKMRQGKLQDALDVYRRALNML